MIYQKIFRRKSYAIFTAFLPNKCHHNCHAVNTSDKRSKKLYVILNSNYNIQTKESFTSERANRIEKTNNNNGSREQ